MRYEKALVTGGAGFIGSHLCDRLISEGFKVVAFDDLSTGSKKNVQHLAEHPRFKLVIGDVTESVQLNSLVEDCDIVYHLAAAVGVRLVIDEPIRSMTTNIRGTETVLQLADRYRKAVFLASSSEVYGKSVQVPFSEDDDLVLGSTQTTRWSYACSKAVDEFLALAYCRDKGLDVTIARYFNTVGPRQSAQYGMVIPRFVKQAIGGKPITVYGNGQQTRTFNHVLDTVEATYRLSVDKQAAGKVFNVGGNAEISIISLARHIKDRTHSSSPIQCIPFGDAFASGDFEDMPRRVPDLTRLRRQVCYQPSRTLDDIIDHVVHHFNSRPAVA